MLEGLLTQQTLGPYAGDVQCGYIVNRVAGEWCVMGACRVVCIYVLCVQLLRRTKRPTKPSTLLFAGSFAQCCDKRTII